MKHKYFIGIIIIAVVLSMSLSLAAPTSMPSSGEVRSGTLPAAAPAGMVTLPNGDRVHESFLGRLIVCTTTCNVQDYEKTTNWRPGVSYDDNSNVWTLGDSEYKFSKSGKLLVRKVEDGEIEILKLKDNSYVFPKEIYIIKKDLSTVKQIDTEYVYFTDGTVAIKATDSKGVDQIWPESIIRSREDKIKNIGNNKITLKDDSTIEKDNTNIITIKTSDQKEGYILPSNLNEVLKAEDGWKKNGDNVINAKENIKYSTSQKDGLTTVKTYEGEKLKEVHTFEGNREVAEADDRDVYRLKDNRGKVIGFCSKRDCTGSSDNPSNVLITDDGKLCSGCSYDAGKDKIITVEEKMQRIQKDIDLIPANKPSIILNRYDSKGMFDDNGIPTYGYKGSDIGSQCQDCFYSINEKNNWVEIDNNNNVVELAPNTPVNGYSADAAISVIESRLGQLKVDRIKSAYVFAYSEKKILDEENKQNAGKEKKLSEEKENLKKSKKPISIEDAKKSCDINEKGDDCVFYKEYIRIQDEEAGALFVGIDFMQGRTLQSFTRVVNALGQYQGWQGLQNWWFPDMIKSDYFKTVTTFFDRTVKAEYQVPDAVCKGLGHDPMSADTISSPGQSAVIIDVGNDRFQSVAAITAERTNTKTVALCADDVPCKVGHCSEQGVCVDDNTNTPLDAYFYKITWSVRAPADEANTPYIDENGYAVFYNVEIIPSDVNIAPFYLYPGEEFGFGSDDTLSLKNGESDNDVYIAYSPVVYDEICLRFAHGPKDIESVEVKDVCTNFAISSASENIWARSSRTGSRGSVRVADLGRKQI